MFQLTPAYLSALVFKRGSQQQFFLDVLLLSSLCPRSVRRGVTILKVTVLMTCHFQRNSSYPIFVHIKHLASTQKQKQAPNNLRSERALDAMFMTCVCVCLSTSFLNAHHYNVYSSEWSAAWMCVSVVCVVYWHAVLNEVISWRMGKVEKCWMA